jgi:hypothetical protein
LLFESTIEEEDGEGERRREINEIIVPFFIGQHPN